MTRRRILLVIGGAFALVVVLAAVAVLLIPAERVGALAASRMEETLDREVRVERARIRLLPRPAVALEGVAVSRHARPDAGATTIGLPAPAAGEVAPDEFGTSLASVERIELRPRLLPLLRRNVVINEIVLERPHLLLEIDEGGTLNLPSFEGEGEPSTADAEISIRRLRLRDGSVDYSDANSGTVVRMRGIEQELRLSGSVAAGELARVALSGVLQVASIDAEVPEAFAVPVRGLRLRVAHDVDLDQAEDRLELRRLDVTVQEVPLEVEGTVTHVSDSDRREVALNAGADAIDIAALVRSLPAALLERLPEGADGEALRGTSGIASLRATVTGRAGGDALPDVDGLLRLDDVRLSYGPYGRGGAPGDLVGGLTGAIAFSLERVSSDGLEGRLLGEPFRLAFAVEDLSDPRGSGQLRGGLDLGEATRLGLLPEGARGSGRVAVDIAAEGAALEPADAVVNGHVALSGVELRLPELLRPVRVHDGRLELRGREARASDLRATMGESDVALDLVASDWIGFALGDDAPRRPQLSFDVRSTLLDLDELTGRADPDAVTFGELFFAHLGDRPVDGRSTTEVAEAMELRLPEIPDVHADGRFRAGRVISDSIAFDEVDVTVRARGGDLELVPARFRMMGGSVTVTARLGGGAGETSGGIPPAQGGAARQGTSQAAGAPRPLVVQYAVNDVTADPFLERYTAFRGHVGGTMMLAGYAQMNLDPNMLPRRESVAAEGTTAFVGGELLNWPLVQALGERLGLSSFDQLAFRDWTGQFRVAGARVILEESLMEAGEMAVRAAGSFDVAGRLDLGATLYLPQSWAGGIPGAPAGFLSALGDGEGRVPVGLSVGGTATRPSLSLDLSQAGAAAAARAREAAAAEAREQAERLGEELGIPLPALDSLAPGADTLRRQVEENVRSRLRRIIPGGG